MDSENKHNDLDDEGSVTRVIRQMQRGNRDGADLLWERFFLRLKLLVRDRFRSRHGISDEEDLALESLGELFQGLMAGKYPSLKNRDEFWRLLVTVASRNVVDQINKERRQKRGGGRVFHESAFGNARGNNEALFEQIAAETETPEVQLMVSERCAELLESLRDPELQAIAVMRVAGSTNQEIADAMGVSLRSIERRLAEIRQYWSSAVES